jgi:hypothetical protein
LTGLSARAAAVTALLLVAFFARRAEATDFHVLEVHAGYELHWAGEQTGHGSYGLGYTWDVFVTSASLRGVEVGGRLDLLHCPECERALDGGAASGLALVSFAKDDLSSVTFYAGLAPGVGYSRNTEALVFQGEVQAALQLRGVYSGLWFRPTLFAGGGGAMDGYLSFGLRLTFGFSPNHGKKPEEPPPPPPPPPGTCDPPRHAAVPAASATWSIPNCFRPSVVARLDGKEVECTNADGALSVRLGRARPGTAQRLEIDIAGGTFPVKIARE